MPIESPDERASDLQLAAASWQALMRSDIPHGLAVLDRQLRFRAINETLARSNGLSVEQHLGRALQEVLPAAAQVVAPLLLDVLESGRPLRNGRVSAEVPSLPGMPSDWDVDYLPVLDAQGSVIAVLAQALNRSQEERALQLRHAGEQQLRRVLDSLFVFVCVLSPEGVLQEANREPLQASGLSLDEVRGQLIWDTPWWNYEPAAQDWIRAAVARAAAGETLRCDREIRIAGEERMLIDFMLAPLRDESGRITHLVPSGIDVSSRLRSEQALRESEDRYRRVFEGSTFGKSLIDGQGHIVLVNQSMALMFGYEPAEMVGMPVHKLVPQARRAAHAGLVADYLQGPTRRYMAQRQELFALRRDGSEFPVEIALNPMGESGRKEILATISDVTERRAAQLEIERALREKTVLLNELHHRVKNNLQVISSLLSLQSRHAEPAVQAALRDSSSRVRSMSLMHQLLYERNDFSALELGPYLRRLGSLLRETYLGENSRVQLQIEAPDTGLRIDLQRAVPCGLLVTELVTNAIKHAFPGEGAGGRVSIIVKLNEPEQLEVDVADDGIGMPPPEPGAKARGLGFQLLPVLAEQCRGRLQQLDGPGTCFRLTLSLQEAALPALGDGDAGSERTSTARTDR